MDSPLDKARVNFISFVVTSKDHVDFTTYKFIANKDSANCINKPVDTNVFFFKILEANSILNSEDSKFIWQQFQDYCDFSLEEFQLKDQTVVFPDYFDKKNSDKFWTDFKSQYKTDSYISLSMPLFSKDLNTALITLRIYKSHEPTITSAHVFKQNNDKWVYHSRFF